METNQFTLEFSTYDLLYEIEDIFVPFVNENILITHISEINFKETSTKDAHLKYDYEVCFEMIGDQSDIDVFVGGSQFATFITHACNDILNEQNSIFIKIDPSTFSVTNNCLDERQSQIFLTNIKNALLMNDTTLLCLERISDLITQSRTDKSNFHEVAIAVNAISKRVFGRNLLGDKHSMIEHHTQQKITTH